MAAILDTLCAGLAYLGIVTPPEVQVQTYNSILDELQAKVKKVAPEPPIAPLAPPLWITLQSGFILPQDRVPVEIPVIVEPTMTARQCMQTLRSWDNVGKELLKRREAIAPDT